MRHGGRAGPLAWVFDPLSQALTLLDRHQRIDEQRFPVAGYQSRRAGRLGRRRLAIPFTATPALACTRCRKLDRQRTRHRDSFAKRNCPGRMTIDSSRPTAGCHSLTAISQSGFRASLGAPRRVPGRRNARRRPPAVRTGRHRGPCTAAGRSIGGDCLNSACPQGRYLANSVRSAPRQDAVLRPWTSVRYRTIRRDGVRAVVNRADDVDDSGNLRRPAAETGVCTAGRDGESRWR